MCLVSVTMEIYLHDAIMEGEPAFGQRGRRFNAVYYDSQAAICSPAGNKRPADLTQQIECNQTAFAASSYQYCVI